MNDDNLTLTDDASCSSGGLESLSDVDTEVDIDNALPSSPGEPPHAGQPSPPTAVFLEARPVQALQHSGLPVFETRNAGEAEILATCPVAGAEQDEAAHRNVRFSSTLDKRTPEDDLFAGLAILDSVDEEANRIQPSAIMAAGETRSPLLPRSSTAEDAEAVVAAVPKEEALFDEAVPLEQGILASREVPNQQQPEPFSEPAQTPLLRETAANDAIDITRLESGASLPSLSEPETTISLLDASNEPHELHTSPPSPPFSNAPEGQELAEARPSPLVQPNPSTLSSAVIHLVPSQASRSLPSEGEQVGRVMEDTKKVNTFASPTAVARTDASDGHEGSLLDVAVSMEAHDSNAIDTGSLDAAPPGQEEMADAAYRLNMLAASLASRLDSSLFQSLRRLSSTTNALQQQEESTLLTTPSNASFGDRLAARAYLSTQLEPVFKAKVGEEQASTTVSVARRGVPCAIAKYMGLIAVGNSAGSVRVLMPAASGKGAPRLVAAEDRSSIDDSITAVALGQHGPGLIMVVGHQSGHVRLWETRSQGPGGAAGMSWVLAKTLMGSHAATVTAAAVIDGGQTTWALTCDAHGRLVCHNVNRHLSLAVQALAGLARQFTSAAGVGTASSVIDLQAAGQDPGVIMSMSPLLANPSPSTKPSPHKSLHSTRQPRWLHATSDGRRFVLITASRAVLLCSVSHDGAVGVMHLFFPPRSVQRGVAEGYAAWRLEGPWDAGLSPPPSMSTLQQGQAAQNENTSSVRSADAAPRPNNYDSNATGVTRAIVAVAWAGSVSVYRAALEIPWPSGSPQRQTTTTSEVSLPQQQQRRPVDGGGGGGGQPSMPLPPPSLLASFSVQGDVCGVGFLATGTFAVMSSESETSTSVTLRQPSALLAAAGAASLPGGAGEEGYAEQDGVERLAIPDWLVGRQLGVPGDPSYHASAAIAGDQALLLTSNGVRVLHLLTWQQRLSALVCQGKLEEALSRAIQLVVEPNMADLTSDAAIVQRGGSCWPADVAPRGQAEEVRRQLLTVLYAMLDTRLRQTTQLQALPDDLQTPTNASQTNLMDALADVAIDACLLINRPDALFSDVAPRFLTQASAAPNARASSFLYRLEPRILSDQLPSLAPEIMQTMVEHFVAERQPERVERIVLKLDVASLDLNQLIPLCLQHRLFGALIHMFARAMHDYQTPAALLLAASAAAYDVDTVAHCHAQSKTGSMRVLSSNAALRLAFKLLVYLRCCLMGQAFPPGNGHPPSIADQETARLHAAAFLLYSSVASLTTICEPWVALEGHADSSISSGLDALQDPIPVLRYLCLIDAPSVLRVLREGLLGWDALEEDVIQAMPDMAGRIAVNDRHQRTLTQVAVDAVVTLIEEQQNEAIWREEGGENGRRTVDRNGVKTASRVAASSSSSSSSSAMLRFVAEHLAANRAAVHGPVLLRVLRFLAAPPADTLPPPLDIHAAPFASSSSSALHPKDREGIFCDIVAHAAPTDDGQRHGWPEGMEALSLARLAGFAQAEARIHDALGNRVEALHCLVTDARHPQSPFRYVREVLGEPSSQTQSNTSFESAVVECMHQLVRLNPFAAASLVAECLPQRYGASLQALSAHPEDQFAFLDAVAFLSQRAGTTAPAVEESAVQNDGSSSNSSSRGALDATLSEFDHIGSLLAPLLADRGVCSLYVRLLCRYRSPAVLPFLQAQDTYDVDACLQHCLEAGVDDAAAYLYERRGDVHSALKLHLAAVKVADRALLDAALGTGPMTEDATRATTHTLANDSGLGASNRDANSGSNDAKPSSSSVAAAATGRCNTGVSENELQHELVAAAESAMRNVVSMCVRFSQDHVTARQQGAAVRLPGALRRKDREQGPVHRVWLEVLAHYIDVLQQVRRAVADHDKQRARAQCSETSMDTATCSSAIAPGMKQDRSTASSGGACARLKALELLLTGFVEEIVGEMSGHVPLQDVAESILERYTGDSFGDFRGTLLGLLGACSFERAIIRSASKIAGADAVGLLRKGYLACMRPKAFHVAPSSL